MASTSASTNDGKEDGVRKTARLIALSLVYIYCALLLLAGIAAVFNEGGGWEDLFKSGLLILGGGLTTVIGYYFGSQGVQEAQEQGMQALQDAKIAQQKGEEAQRRMERLNAEAEEKEAEIRSKETRIDEMEDKIGKMETKIESMDEDLELLDQGQEADDTEDADADEAPTTDEDQLEDPEH